MVISVVVGIGVFVAIFVGLNLLVNKLPTKWEERVRPWVFVGPALLFLGIFIVMPLLRTIYLSFRSGRRGEGGFTLDNYTNTLSDKTVVNFDNWTGIFSSWPFIISVVAIIVAVVFGRRYASKSYGSGKKVDFSSPIAVTCIVLACIGVLFAIFSSLRGVLWNNLWWVAAVTGLATAFGLGFAVLADRAKGENLAKTLVFMPFAMSMVAAAIIWTYIYNLPAAGQSPGLLNEVIGWFGIDPVDFVRSASIIPWNNFFIMIIMIWIQTGFALVVLSAAIKGVPTELIEAAKVDGASEGQTFWKITIPQILPTIIVVVTTLIVTIMKVFDLVKATTNGNFDTDVLANRMYEGLRNGNFTLSSTFAVIILVLVIPIVWFNGRRGRREVK